MKNLLILFGLPLMAFVLRRILEYCTRSDLWKIICFASLACTNSLFQ